MIRCKVTLAGVVNKAATTHEGKDGKPFVSFGVNLPLGDKNGNVREFNVGVTASSELVMAGLVAIGKRVQVVGTLYFRKYEDGLYFNLYADSVTIDVSEIDKLEGEMEFMGRTGNKEIKLLNDKRGKKFQTFSAYSKENSGEQATFIWVHFLNFAPDKATWLRPAASIVVKGDLEVKLYNQNLDLGCRVKEITEWQYEDKTPKKEEEVQVF